MSPLKRRLLREARGKKPYTRTALMGTGASLNGVESRTPRTGHLKPSKDCLGNLGTGIKCYDCGEEVWSAEREIAIQRHKAHYQKEHSQDVAE